MSSFFFFFFFKQKTAYEIRTVTGVQTCALPIYTLLVSQLVLVWRGRCGEAQERGAEHGRTDGEESRDEKCNLVAAVDGGEGVESCAQQGVCASGGEAGKDGETERTTHHERGVDDT